MSFPLYIARRYLFSKKSHNVINVISLISTVVVAIVTFAMVVVLSAFNGIEKLVDDLYQTFDADISITPKVGKTFSTTHLSEDEIRAINGVLHYSEIVEGDVLIQYENRQHIGKVKGVEEDFLNMGGMDTVAIYQGSWKLEKGQPMTALMGLGLKYELGLSLEQPGSPLVKLFAPKRGKKISKFKKKAFYAKHIPVTGIFSINADFDTQYMLTPLDFAADLFGYENEVTAVEIGLREESDPERVRDALKQKLGGDFWVKTRREKNKLIYETNRTEKWISFVILSFILMIASFNVIASLTMLIIEKKRDVFSLKSMGARRQTVRRIFFYEGLLINGLGVLVGLFLGVIVCQIQIHLGIIPLEGTVVEHYPVELLFSDFFFIALAVMTVGTLFSWLPAKLLSSRGM